MKKLLDLGSLAVIVIALVILGYVLLPSRPAQAAKSTGAFGDFPAGQARVINLSARREALEDLTPREQVDQMRDWLLFTAVSASGLSADEINRALFDLPPTRHGFMQSVANFEYGDTRSCYLGGEQVLALVPADASEERVERLARIADGHRKNLGETLAKLKLVVFEYELQPSDDPSRQTATLTRRDTVDAADLFERSAGYHEAKIGGPEDFRRFMGQIDDLTYASLKDGLTLGGRKIKGHSYRGIGVEEVAALYQSEAKIRGSRNALIEEQRQASRASTPVGSSGFSLDPSYDYARLAARFDADIAPRLRRFYSGRMLGPARDASIAPASGELAPVGTVAQKLKEAREGLARRDAGPLLGLLVDAEEKGAEGKELAREIEQSIKEHYGYQAARYIGELQGTEAGMVLFYTDLLAKLWAINYQRSAPAADVPGFRPMTALPVSSVYMQELNELSNTRLWFGPQDKGFQVADNGRSMLFARNATRVYAASSNSLKPGDESEPNAHSAAFLGWWDDHYEEIARFEPEYERLNELMKWSLVIAWLNQKEQAGGLGFLQGVPVERGHWFPDWVKQRPLRYTAWDKIGFYERGRNGATTESLPRLQSEVYKLFGRGRSLSGGVSLAGEETLARRPPLSPDSKVAQNARRSNLNYAPAESSSSALKTLEGTAYSFSSTSPERAATTATAREGAKQRGRFGEAANQPVEHTVARLEGGMSFGARLGGVPHGELIITNAENGFSAGWAGRDLGTAMSLGRRLSRSTKPAEVLALDPNVEASIKLPADGSYLVKLGGSERWLRVTPEGAPATSLKSGYAARVGDFGAGAKNYNLAWVSPGEVPASLSGGDTLWLRPVAGTLSRYEMLMGASRPSGVPVSIEHGASTVSGKLDPVTNEISFAYADLPQPLRQDPSLLRRLVAEAKPSAAGGGRYVVGDSRESVVVEYASRGDYRAAARELWESPDAVKAQLEAHRRAGLDECKGLMRIGEYELASRRLDELIQIHGAREELSLHKAVVTLNLPRQQRDLLARLVTDGAPPTVWDEINAQRGPLFPVARRGDDINLQRVVNDVAVRYEILSLDGAMPLAREESHHLKAYIFVEDTPGPNNLDGPVSSQRTLDAAISGEFNERVIKLPRRVDVARFRPAIIYDKSTGITYRAADTDGPGRGLLLPRYYFGSRHPSRRIGGGFLPRGHLYLLPCVEDDDSTHDDDDDDDCDDEEKDTDVVIVRQ